MKKVIIPAMLALVLYAGSIRAGSPKDTAVCVFPVSEETSICVENENIKPILFRTDGESEPQMAYVIYDDTAHLRLETAASDNPVRLIFSDFTRNTSYELPELLDPERDVFVCDVPMPGADAGPHYVNVCLADNSTDEEKILYGIYLISGDEYIEELTEDMKSLGDKFTLEYVESSSAEKTVPQAYILHVIDQDGEPVPGVMVSFCTDISCIPVQADENGIIAFDGAPDTYHVQLLSVPEGYSFDPGFEMTTRDVYGEWALYIRKD